MHWTYEEIQDASGDLEQGDIIAPTEELRAVLRDIHSHFDQDKYLSYCIATQSCDLVRRTPVAKAKYISIAAVRSLKAVFPNLLSEIETPLAPRVFRAKARDKAQQLLTRIINQNEQGLGLFYLHQDAGIGLGENAVVYLRVTVALRAEHYETLVAARRGRLSSEFRSKFGWLLGNLYSRSATRDWDDDPLSKKESRDVISGCLQGDAQSTNGKICWLADDLAAAAETKQIIINEVPHEELENLLRPHLPPSKFDLAVDEVLRAAKEALKIPDTDPKWGPFRARLNALKKFIK